MDLDEKSAVFLSARLTLHEYLLTTFMTSTIAALKLPPEGLDALGRQLRAKLATRMSTSSAPATAEIAFEVQRSTLEQFDSLWSVVAHAARGAAATAAGQDDR